MEKNEIRNPKISAFVLASIRIPLTNKTLKIRADWQGMERELVKRSREKGISHADVLASLFRRRGKNRKQKEYSK